MYENDRQTIKKAQEGDKLELENSTSNIVKIIKIILKKFFLMEKVKIFINSPYKLNIY